MRSYSVENRFFAFSDKNNFHWIHPKGDGLHYFDSQNRKLIPFNTNSGKIKWRDNDRCYCAFSYNQIGRASCRERVYVLV